MVTLGSTLGEEGGSILVISLSFSLVEFTRLLDYKTLESTIRNSDSYDSTSRERLYGGGGSNSSLNKELPPNNKPEG